MQIVDHVVVFWFGDGYVTLDREFEGRENELGSFTSCYLGAFYPVVLVKASLLVCQIYARERGPIKCLIYKDNKTRMSDAQ